GESTPRQETSHFTGTADAFNPPISRSPHPSIYQFLQHGTICFFAMYSPDKMMNGKPSLHPPISAPSSCFPGRYSPTYRSPDPMRRCMPNPS
ncbi:hypothetical protein L9F63_004456, partial [Diploptera punctata]